MRKVFFAMIGSTVFLSACSMILQPTTSFDRRRVASSYGTIINQSNPACANCTDRFLVKKADGALCTVVVGYDGRVKLLE